jgi:hypothetical protein
MFHRFQLAPWFDESLLKDLRAVGVGAPASVGVVIVLPSR